MQSVCNGPILLGTIAICVALAVMESDINMKKPFCPKMCERFCNQISGCSSYIYITSDLSCHQTQAKSPKQNPGKKIYRINVTKDKQRMDAKNAAKCHQGWNMFRTRVGIIQCRPILSSHPTLPTRDEEREDRMARMFMWSSRVLKQQLLYLHNNSVVEYPFGHIKGCRQVAYISSKRKLVVASYSKIMFFTPIDEEKKTIIKTEIIVNAIAIDDHKQLVFMKIVTPQRGVCVMSTDGKNFTLLFSLGRSTIKYSGGLVADRRRSLIYVLYPLHKMLQVTYKGVLKGNIVKTGIGREICIDMQEDFLYYQDQRNNLCKLSLSDHSVTTFSTLKIPSIWKMLVVGNFLYMTPFQFEGDLLAVDMSGLCTVTKINIGKQQVTMCLIP